MLGLFKRRTQEPEQLGYLMAAADPPVEYHDKKLTCMSCGADFIFEAGEAEFFASKNPPLSEPKRCPDCRRIRAERRLKERLADQKGEARW